jgi:hypothetical protein
MSTFQERQSSLAQSPLVAERGLTADRNLDTFSENGENIENMFWDIIIYHGMY